jgi:hypothetical protein
VDLWKDDAPAVGWNGTYGTFLFAGEAVRVIKEYGPKIMRRAKAGSPETNGPNVTRGMFIYLAFQNTHAPLQIPTQYCYNSTFIRDGRRIASRRNSTSSGPSVSVDNKCPTEGPDIKHHSFCYCYDDENISDTQSAATATATATATAAANATATLRPSGPQDVTSSMHAHWNHDRHQGGGKTDIPSRVAASSAPAVSSAPAISAASAVSAASAISAAGLCPGNRTLSGSNSDRHTFNAMAM